MSELTSDALCPGDLVFLAPKDNDDIGRKVVELDRGRFSHVGILVETGVMASARTQNVELAWPPDADIDAGGVRLNALRDLAAHREVFAAPVTDEAWRAAALLHMRRYLEVGAPGPSGFSYLKLFLIALGLNALSAEEPARTEMLGPVIAAAGAWDSREQERNGQTPTFFCSEYVAGAYPLTYTLADFERRVVRPALLPDGTGDLRQLFERLRSELRQVSGRQRTTLWRALRATAEHDPDFLAEMIGDLLRLLGHRSVAPDDPGRWVGDLPAEVPAALVTPRMLECDDRLHGDVQPVTFD